MNKNKFLLAIVCSGLVLTGCGGPTTPSTSTSKTDSGTGSSKTDDPDAYYPKADSGQNFSTEGYDADYSQKSWREKSEILYSLEKYAMENFVGGIPLYDDSSYEQFSKRVNLPSTKYLTNYGFGVGYGTITGESMYNGNIVESVPEWKSYFHGYTNTDSGSFNGWDASGSDVSDRTSMITSSYFGVKANADNTSYAWEGSLSKTAAPIMLDASGKEVDKATITEETTSKYWRVYLHYGDGYTYHTAPTSKWKSKYDGRKVALADYITPFKSMLDNKLSRFAELVSDTSGFEGAMDYVYNTNLQKEDWSKSGVGIQMDEKLGCLNFTFIQPKSTAYARTSLSSGLYSPMPMEFLTDIGGVKNYGKYGANTNYYANFDNILTFGPYIPEYWQKDTRIVYKKNVDYYEASQYHFDGYTEDVFSGDKADEDAYKAFLENKLDEATIPSSMLEQHKNDERVYRTEGSTIIKLNVNSTTEEEWEHLFGTNGTVYKHPEKNYWNVKPIMSNEKFLWGVYYCIDRKELAEAAGRNPAMAYLSNAYMLDPSGTQSYRASKWGKAVIREYQEIANNEYCYSSAVAQAYFAAAVEDLMKDGMIERGEKITVNGTYRYQSTIDNLGKYIKKYVEDNFNTANKKYGITLELKLEVAGSQYTDAYTRMDHGEFDFAEGAVSGNVLNPIDFMSTVSSTKSLNQGFCLNWGTPTNEMSKHPCVYDGYRYTFDALWSISQGFTPIDDGKSVAIADNQKLTNNGNTVLFTADYPANATDDEGRSLYEFEAKDVALLFGSTSSASLGGYYLQKGYKFSTGMNGDMRLEVDKSQITSLATQVANDNKGTAISYFNLYFTLVYKIKVGNNIITKSIQIVQAGKMTDFGMQTITK